MDDSHADEGRAGDRHLAPTLRMARERYGPYRWVQVPVAVLAVWLVVSPWALGYQRTGLYWSDVISGAVALGMAFAARRPDRGLVSWITGFVGVWLMLAPLVLRAKEAAAYANDTLVGALIITFAAVIPMNEDERGGAVPPGWSYNPSAWSQRAPVIALGLVGFSLARGMAAYQLGYVQSLWDPVFGNGTQFVLTSKVSRAFPVSDAGLGAVSYLLEVLLGLMGGTRRWRTTPWMLAAFGVLVVPLGIVSTVLILLQPVAVGAWCAPCLATAVAMLFMVTLSIDEIVAVVQLLARTHREGQSVWRVFWLGADQPEDTPVAEPARPATFRPRGMLWGVTGHWTLWLSAAAGVWLMCAPAFFGVPIQAPAADSDHVAGALVVVTAIIALAEVARPVRFLNVPLGLWLVAAPWFLPGGTELSRWNSAVFGALVVLWSLPLGRLRDHYGSFDRAVVWSPRASARARNLHEAWLPEPAR